MTRSLRLYIASVTLAFWGGLVAACLNGGMPSLNHPAELAPLFGIAVAAEALVVHRRQKSGNDSFSFSATAHVAVAVLFGPVVAGIVAALTVVVVDGMRLADRDVIMMNSSLFGISAALSGSAFIVAGGTVGTVDANDALPLVALIVVRFAANEVILSGAVALSRGQRFLRVLRDGMRATAGGSMGEGSLGVLIAFGYSSERWVILPFLAPLLAALYQSRSNLERLRNETDDALNALAGVIDERDPSTAEHSSRVAALVERFVEAIGLPDREAERLVAAARFHDLGKVAVDVATLSKDGRLTEEELRAIRSHPRLSAQLLSPFGFAQEMALYAELHHERYDGNGYYSVSPREVPVEAHVLIAADSFDAMTSKRAYRAALSTEEAVQELRDKAGSQFHPGVAQAFAAMIEGHDVDTAIGRNQATALRAEFSRIPLVRFSRPSSLTQSEPLPIYLAAATLLALGVPGVPQAVMFALLTATAIAIAVRALRGYERGRTRAAVRELVKRGHAPAEVVRGAGIGTWAVWLTWDDERREYAISQIAAAEMPSDTELREVTNRAMRPGTSVLSGFLSTGVHVTLTRADSRRPRLAVGSERPLTAQQCDLMQELCEEHGGVPEATGGELVALPSDARIAEPASRALVVAELNVFEDVRIVAGQLSAQRVVEEAAARMRRLVRGDDMVVTLGEDMLALVVEVPDQETLDAICERAEMALREVPVPRRAIGLRPRLRASLPPFTSDRYVHEVAVSLGLAAPDQRAAS
jgi:GGDEF domain-containing protein